MSNEKTVVRYEGTTEVTIPEGSVNKISVAVASSLALAIQILAMRFVKGLWLLFVAIVLAVHLTDATPLMRDDTDDPGWFGERSRMELRIDRGTGCQYLSSGSALAPRLDANGKHICK